MTPPVGILQLLLARGVGAQTMNRLLGALRRDARTLDDLTSDWPRDLVERAGLRPQLATAIEDTHTEADRLAEELAAHDVRVLVRGFAPYPATLSEILGDSAPPLLFARGDLGILGMPSVGFAGSRKCSPQGLAIAHEAARELAQRGANIVSGYANGVDLAAHRAALEAGGATTLVLAEGLLHFRTKGHLADVFDSGRYLVLSEFPPRLKWLGRSAMQRNWTICALSRVLVVVESGLEGGTFAAAQTAQELRVPLFVVDFANPPPGAEGNAYLLQRGATPLRSNGKGRPNLVAVVHAAGLSKGAEAEICAPVAAMDNGPAAPSAARPDEPAQSEQENRDRNGVGNPCRHSIATSVPDAVPVPGNQEEIAMAIEDNPGEPPAKLSEKQRVADYIMGYLCRHLVCLGFRYVLLDERGRRSDKQYFVAYTGFVMAVEGEWFILTAGHVLKRELADNLAKKRIELLVPAWLKWHRYNTKGKLVWSMKLYKK